MDLWEHALGFMDSQILLTAADIGVFDRLETGPCTLAQIALATGLPEDSTERLLTALCAMGIVNKLQDGRFVNQPKASEQLVRGKPGYICGTFRHVKYALYPSWRFFKEALIERSPQ
jgi:hypothetical protein